MTSKYRKWAQGHDAGCQIRLPGCQFGPTVGAHIPSSVRLGKSMSSKPDDLFLCLACDFCHSAIDGRSPMPPEVVHVFQPMDGKVLRLYIWYESWAETLLIAKREGMVVLK